MRRRWPPRRCLDHCISPRSPPPPRPTLTSTQAFHHTGRYLISGGLDTRVNLWTLPSLEANSPALSTRVIHYPHFSSTEIHYDYVDSIAFHGDLILSKAARENRILVWRIAGFSPSATPHAPPPPSSSAPTATAAQRDTRSAFAAATPDDPAFQLLMTLDLPACENFYLRFALFSPPAPSGRNAVLAAGNEHSRVFFWDLGRLERRGVTRPRTADPAPAPAIAPAPSRRRRGAGSAVPLKRESSLASSTGATPLTPSEAAYGAGTSTAAPYFGGPFSEIRAHRTFKVQGPTFYGRQCAWSAGGEWCAVVGDRGTVCLFGRWGKAGAAGLGWAAGGDGGHAVEKDGDGAAGDVDGMEEEG